MVWIRFFMVMVLCVFVGGCSGTYDYSSSLEVGSFLDSPLMEYGWGESGYYRTTTLYWNGTLVYDSDFEGVCKKRLVSGSQLGEMKLLMRSENLSSVSFGGKVGDCAVDEYLYLYLDGKEVRLDIPCDSPPSGSVVRIRSFVRNITLMPGRFHDCNSSIVDIPSPVMAA